MVHFFIRCILLVALLYTQLFDCHSVCLSCAVIVLFQFVCMSSVPLSSFGGMKYILLSQRGFVFYFIIKCVLLVTRHSILYCGMIFFTHCAIFSYFLLIPPFQHKIRFIGFCLWVPFFGILR